MGIYNFSSTCNWVENTIEIYVGQIAEYSKKSDSYKCTNCQSIYDWAVGDYYDDPYFDFEDTSVSNQLMSSAMEDRKGNNIEGYFESDYKGIKREINLTQLIKGSYVFGSKNQFNCEQRESPSILNPFFRSCGYGEVSLLFKDISIEETRKRLESIFPSSKHDFINSKDGQELFKSLVTFEIFEGMPKDEFLKIMQSIGRNIAIEDSEVPDFITKDFCQKEICSDDYRGFGYIYADDGRWETGDLEQLRFLIPYFYDLKQPGMYFLGIDKLSEVNLTGEFTSEKEYSLKEIENFEIFTGFTYGLDDDIFPSDFQNEGLSINNCCDEYFDIKDIIIKDKGGDEIDGYFEFDGYSVDDRSVIVYKITPEYELIPLRAYFEGASYDVEDEYNWSNLDECVIKRCQDFNKDALKEDAPKKSLTKTQSLALNFWTRFNEKIAESGKQLKTRKPNTDTWYDFSIGNSKVCVRVSLSNREQFVSVGLYISNDKELFDKLEASKREIERKLQFSLDWDRQNDQKCSRIAIRIFGLDLEDQQKCESIMDQIIDKADVLQKVFKEYLN